jgi:hypothetical protein
VAGAGTAYSVSEQNAESRERQRLLEEELRGEELAALDEENERLKELRLANQEIIAGSGNIDPYASASLVAARRFNFQTTLDDVANIRYNITSYRRSVSARIGIFRRNRSAATTMGMLNVASTLAQGVNTGKGVYG